MSMVGGFPSMRDIMRRTVRGPVNPLDKSTLISIYPRPINIHKITLTPGRWYLAPGSLEHPTLLTIGPSSWFRDVNIDEPLIEIVQSSIQIAESCVKDWLNGIFACNMIDAMPGFFFIPGKVGILELRAKYQNLLDEAHEKQMNYYRSLTKYGDALWARSNGNPLAVSDEMRLAAKTLGMQDKDWMKDHAAVGMQPCFACGEFKNPEYAICKACHSIDPNHPKAALIRRFDPNTQFAAPPVFEPNPFESNLSEKPKE